MARGLLFANAEDEVTTPKKVETVERILGWLRAAKVTVLTEYRGLAVGELTRLRRQLREAGVEYHVAKNTLTLRAATQLGLDGGLAEALRGPTALALGFKDEVSAARLLTEYIRASRGGPLRIKGAILGGRLLSAEDVDELANLPALEVLRGQFAGTVQGPLASLVGTFEAALRSLLYVCEQRVEQMGGGEQAA